MPKPPRLIYCLGALKKSIYGALLGTVVANCLEFSEAGLKPVEKELLDGPEKLASKLNAGDAVVTTGEGGEVAVTSFFGSSAKKST